MPLALRMWSYGCTWEVWRALKKLELFSAIASSNFYASFVLSKFPACFHIYYISIRTLSMNQFFNNIVTATWALKHVLFVIHYKVLTKHGEEKKGSHYIGF